MKRNPITLVALLGLFILMIILLVLQSTQQASVSVPIPPTANETLRDNEIQLEYGLVFPDIQAKDVGVINILDPVLDSQVSVAQSPEGVWQVISDETKPTNQEYANSLAITLEKMPYTTRLGIANRNQYSTFGLNEQDTLIVVSAIMRDGTLHTLMVGNPVSTDDTSRGFYTIVDDKEEIYIVPPEPILYLLQYLEVFEETQKLDN